jgi:hypothetical protein
MENYFNYFTEIEEFFWKKRGTTFLLTTLDWALIDSWKEAKIPIESVLKGIERSFEKQDKKRSRVRMVNSLAYCQQAVLEAAAEQERGALQHEESGEPFDRVDLSKFFLGNSEKVLKAAAVFDAAGRAESAATMRTVASSLAELAADAQSEAPFDLEAAERRLTVLEDKMFSTLLAAASEAELIDIRAEMDKSLAPVRSKMAADQIALLQKQFQKRKLLEKANLPRLSLFYI